MIKDQYGDKIHTFSMDEIIREALSFVSNQRTSSMQEEIKDPKAKGGKGAKAEVTT